MDKFEEEHNKALDKLIKCEHRVNNSCFNCNTFFTCSIRSDYVLKTYKSMSKDNVGGFEF